MIVLAGGTSNIPSISKSLKETLGTSPHVSKDTALVISEGAVREAIQLWEESNQIQKKIVYNDKSLFDFGIGMKNHEFDLLIPANSSLPMRKKKDYTTEKDNQKILEVFVYQRKINFENALKTF